MELKNGTLLQGSKYKIGKILGQGGFGITYKAYQFGLNREVAIKEFYMNNICSRTELSNSVSLSSLDSQELWNGFKLKFLKEARTIAALSHPNIIKIIDVFEENDTAYYVMEYLPGGSLKVLVQKTGRLDEERALTIIRDVGQALEYIHSNNILHLDIKPDNIMMRNDKIPTIIDFGISKRYDEVGNQTSIMQVGHSRGYAPIEQYKQGGLSSFTPATDVYSLAATLYYLLQGHRPPEPRDIYDNGLPVIQTISDKTMQAIQKAMAVKRSERPQSVSCFLKMLGTEATNTAVQFDVANYRNLIESLESDKNYKEAYNQCLEAIKNGNDVEYSKIKSSELIAKMKRKSSMQSLFSVLVAIVISILFIVLSIILS